MNVQNTIKYGMRNVATNAVLQRFSFNILIEFSAFIVAGVNVEVKWQAGHTGDHRMLLLVGEVSPIPTETMINHRAMLPLGADEITG
ncbi:MAG: hypothetical protein EOM61_04235 [Bacteroidia bacterium]|nr:hypothetical protein [Bacteroidia bacterium]